jgi:hypothetical protein
MNTGMSYCRTTLTGHPFEAAQTVSKTACDMRYRHTAMERDRRELRHISRCRLGDYEHHYVRKYGQNSAASYKAMHFKYKLDLYKAEIVVDILTALCRQKYTSSGEVITIDDHI